MPAEFDGYRIVFLSDTHYGRFSFPWELRRAVNRANELKPDAVILGGDYTDNSPKYVEGCLAALKGFRAKDGVFAVCGNHDYTMGIANTRRDMEADGYTLVENLGVWIARDGARIRICGLDDLWRGQPDIQAALGDATPADFVILACHNPDYAERAPRGVIDLMLSGHTHGGQVTLFGLWAPFASLSTMYGGKYRTGFITAGRCPVYVTNGVGTLGFPLRYFAPPSIENITLHRGEPQTKK